MSSEAQRLGDELKGSLASGACRGGLCEVVATQIDHLVALAQQAEGGTAGAEFSALTTEESAEVDAALDLVDLPPIRVSAEAAGRLRRGAERRGVILQAHVRHLLTPIDIGRRTSNAQTPMGRVCYEAYAKAFTGTPKWDIAAQAVADFLTTPPTAPQAGAPAGEVVELTNGEQRAPRAWVRLVSALEKAEFIERERAEAVVHDYAEGLATVIRNASQGAEVRQPLSEERMTAIYRKVFGLIDSRPVGPQIEFIRAIERAHGIGGKSHE